ncbi:MAG: hypothetical protein WC405_09155 [Syntrophales bacterium]
MATIEQEIEAKSVLSKVLEELSKTNLNDLVRLELGQDLNFEYGKQVFERTIKLFEDLRQSNLDNVPFSVLEDLKNQAKNVFDRFQEIKDFSLAKHPQNPIAERDRIINTIRDKYDAYFRSVSPIISYSIRKGTDFKELEDNAKSVVESLEKIKNIYEEKQKKITEDMDSTLQKVRQAAAEVGVAQHSIHFQAEADFHNRISNKWLLATIGFAAATIAWGIICFFIQPPEDTAKIIQYTIAKLVILSAIYYLLIWSAKNYTSHRHNYTINKHRQNSLSTFETFVKAAGNDPDTKNAVLLQATQSIFSAQSSGYVNKESEAESPNKFIEIIRSVGTPAKK